MYNSTATGFCPDAATGACTVQKPWDGSGFRCPGASPDPPPEVLHPQATPDVGHTPIPLAGLALSASSNSAGDGASLFSQAFQAVDNLTSTCTLAVPSKGVVGYGSAFLTIVLPQPMRLDNLTLLMGSATDGLSLLAGNDSSGGGLANPLCTSGLALSAGRTSAMACPVAASVLTLNSSQPFAVCDVSLVVPQASSGSSGGGSSSSSTTTTITTATTTIYSGYNSSNNSFVATTSVSANPSTAVNDNSKQQVVDVLPVGGVEFSFAITGTTVENFSTGKAESVCAVLKLLVVMKLGEQAVMACTITSVASASASSAAAAATARRRRALLASSSSASSMDVLLVAVALQTTQAGAVMAALEQARSDGSLAAELANIGLQLVKAATSNVTTSDTAAAAAANTRSGSGASMVGAVVGGAVGGAALVVGITGTILLVQRRRQHGQAAETKLDDVEQGAVEGFRSTRHLTVKAKVGQAKECKLCWLAAPPYHPNPLHPTTLAVIYSMTNHADVPRSQGQRPTSNHYYCQHS